MKRNEPISTTTLNELCLILSCPVESILSFEPSVDELNNIQNIKASIPMKKEKRN